jgi:adenylate cyclase
LVTDMAATMSYVGTEGFLPPEGSGTPQADIYSFGKVLYEMSTGKDRHDFPEPPTMLGEFADREEWLELNEIIKRACERDVRKRYATAQAINAELMLLRAGKSVRRSHWLAAMTKVSVASSIIMLLTCGVGLLFLTNELGDGLVRKSFDLPFALRPYIYPTEAAIVYVDAGTYQHLDQKQSEPLPRSYYTRLLDRLTADKAKAIVFDIIFAGPREPATDEEFAKAIATNGRVILAMNGFFEDRSDNGYVQMMENYSTLPHKSFTDKAAALALSSLSLDPDKVVRSYSLNNLNKYNKAFGYGSEALAVASVLNDSFKTNKAQREDPIWINYYGPSDSLRGVSLYQAIADKDVNMPPGFFRDKVVFVGSKAGKGFDEYSVPFPKRSGQKMPGVAIHATAYLNLIRGDSLHRFSHAKEKMIIIAFGILLGSGSVFCRPRHTIFAALAAGILVAAINYWLFAFYRYWFPWLIVIAAQIPVSAIAGVWRSALVLDRNDQTAR